MVSSNQVNPKCDMYFQILRTLIRGTDELFKIHEPDRRVPSAIATDIDEYEISDDEHVNNTTIGIKRKSQDTSVEQQLLLLRSLVEEKENDNQNKRHEKSFGATHAAVPADESSDEDNGEQGNRVHGDDEDNDDKENRSNAKSSSNMREINNSSSSSSSSTKTVNFGREANRNLQLRQLQDHNNAGAKLKKTPKDVPRN